MTSISSAAQPRVVPFLTRNVAIVCFGFLAVGAPLPVLALLMGWGVRALAARLALRHQVNGLPHRFGHRLPVIVGEAIDRLEEHCAVREQHRARLRRGVLRPLQAGVADVNGQKAHGGAW